MGGAGGSEYILSVARDAAHGGPLGGAGAAETILWTLEMWRTETPWAEAGAA